MKTQIMKYIVLTVLGFYTISAQARIIIPWTQEGCESIGGIWIVTNSASDTSKGCDATHCNHKSFCASPTDMNWWSIYSWCHAIGAEPAPFSSVCPGTTPADDHTSGICPNIVASYSGSYNLWTTTPYKSEHLSVRSDGSVHQFNNSGRGATIRALCEKE